MISLMYVALRLDHHQVSVETERNLGVEVLGYTQNIDDGKKFIELVAAKDVHDKDWSYEKHGEPFYDPLNDEKDPPPSGKFGVWDDHPLDIDRDDPVLDRPTSVVASVSVYSEEKKGLGPSRVLLRAYKLCAANPLVSDFVAATSEGDLEMQRQIIEGAPSL